MSQRNETCKHLSKLELILSKKRVCDKCVAMRDTWVHLRICQTCAEVNCCDSSKNKHATKHYHETGHPVVISAEPGEKWAWCYTDEIFVEY
jgi:uncharacterized UBP type Zn finger protein